MTKNLTQWLSWIESCHPEEIELGLTRCKRVLERLINQTFSFPVITVAGTNGKGSTVAVLEALAQQTQVSSLVLTSPHFLDFRERLRFNTHWLTEQQHIEAFEAVETARQDETLTYFEFTTLAAIKCAELLQPDVLILETGLGGRLDAVNILAADIAIITTVDYDHQDWLGNDLETIAREKAGIIHEDKIAIIADPEFPNTIVKEINLITNHLHIAGQDYIHNDNSNNWLWKNNRLGPWQLENLPFPNTNAAAAIQAWNLLNSDLFSSQSMTNNFVQQALNSIVLPGRFDIVSEKPMVILDVAHNPQAFRELSRQLNKQDFQGRTFVVLGMLKDKNAKSCLEVLKSVIDQWYIADLPVSRGRSANNLKELLKDSEIAGNKLQCYPSPLDAFNAVVKVATKNDRILVTGSFYVVAPVLKLVKKRIENSN